MRAAILYSSVTGNTERVAAAIQEELEKQGNTVVFYGKPQENVEADIYFAGSWTDKGTCSGEMALFLNHIEGGCVAWFGTAGFGGSEEYYRGIYKRVQENASREIRFLGYFYCQGRMPASIRDRYEKLLESSPSDGARFCASIENYDKALSHPDEEDLRAVKRWVREMLSLV